jgi:hypothetical protein
MPGETPRFAFYLRRQIMKASLDSELLSQRSFGFSTVEDEKVKKSVIMAKNFCDKNFFVITFL